MIREEDQLQRAIVQVLHMAAAPGVWWFAVPNGGYRHFPEARILKGLGVRAGVHDIILCIPPDGKMAGLELKSSRGRTSAAQDQAHDDLKTAGGLSSTANNLEDAINTLIYWGAVQSNRIKITPRLLPGRLIKPTARIPAAGV